MWYAIAFAAGAISATVLFFVVWVLLGGLEDDPATELQQHRRSYSD
ncbi:hypothetical protein [Kaistia sp. 32K]|nr:hypothetical protein [Kaistia sp. 32K]